MKLLVTGAAGFLGWHTLARAATLDGIAAIPIDRTAFAGAALEEALRTLSPTDAVLHLAGINRTSTEDQSEVRDGNIALADRLIPAYEATGCRARLVTAGPLQADMTGDAESPYGIGKRLAAEKLAAYAERTGLCLLYTSRCV